MILVDIAAFVIAVCAVVFAVRANGIAKEANSTAKEALGIERGREHRDLEDRAEREAEALTASLVATIERHDEEGTRVLVIQNDGPGSAHHVAMIGRPSTWLNKHATYYKPFDLTTVIHKGPPFTYKFSVGMGMAEPPVAMARLIWSEDTPAGNMCDKQHDLELRLHP